MRKYLYKYVQICHREKKNKTKQNNNTTNNKNYE